MSVIGNILQYCPNPGARKVCIRHPHQHGRPLPGNHLRDYGLSEPNSVSFDFPALPVFTICLFVWCFPFDVAADSTSSTHNTTGVKLFLPFGVIVKNNKSQL